MPQLASKVRTPLQAGENYYGARDLLNFLDSGGVHYAMGDLMRIGGVTGWMRTVGVAAAAGIQFSNHLYPEFAAHLLRVTPTAHWLEWVDWAHPILATPLQPEAGMVAAPDVPGAGLSWASPPSRSMPSNSDVTTPITSGEVAMLTVREAFFEVARQLGLTTIFGNPGSTEEPFLKDFPTDFRYVLALQEAPAVAMADAYCAAHRPAGIGQPAYRCRHGQRRRKHRERLVQPRAADHYRGPTDT